MSADCHVQLQAAFGILAIPAVSGSPAQCCCNLLAMSWSVLPTGWYLTQSRVNVRERQQKVVRPVKFTCGLLLTPLVRVTLQEEGCQPNVVTYNTLIDVYGKMGRWEDAVQVLDDMTDKVTFHQRACTVSLRSIRPDSMYALIASLWIHEQHKCVHGHHAILYQHAHMVPVCTHRLAPCMSMSRDLTFISEPVNMPWIDMQNASPILSSQDHVSTMYAVA